MQHCRDYCGAQNLLVVAVGTQSLNKIEKMVRKSFGQIPRAPKDAPDYSQMDLPFLGVPLSQCLTAYFHYKHHCVIFTGVPWRQCPRRRCLFCTMLIMLYRCEYAGR